MAAQRGSSQNAAATGARTGACARPCVFALTALLILAGLLGAAGPTQAARLKVLDYHARNNPNQLMFTPVCSLKLTGEIMGGDPDNADPEKRKGDYERVKETLEAFVRRPDIAESLQLPHDEPLYDASALALCLDSRGGDINEALKISELFRVFMTVVAEGEQCISACAFIFMRAKPRTSVNGVDSLWGGRHLHHTAKLGFHAPSLTRAATDQKPMTPKDVADAYRRALATLRAVVFPGVPTPPLGSRSHFVGWSIYFEQDLPLDLIAAFLTVPPEEVYFVRTFYEALYWGIDIFGLPVPKAITTRMLTAACMNFIEGTGAVFIRPEEGPKQPRKLYALRYTYYVRDYKVSRNDNFPSLGPADDAQLIAFDLRQVPGGDTCRIRAGWRANRLEILSLAARRISEKPEVGATDDEVLKAFRQRSASRPPGAPSAPLLPLWTMMPGIFWLSDVAQSGWEWLEEGEPFFDKPILPVP